MGLLDKIQTKLQLEAPVPEPVKAPTSPPDNILDMDLRDAFIRDTMAVADNPIAQKVLWDQYKATGTNLITLQAAVKAICKITDLQLIDKYGKADTELVLKTAADWAADSNYSKLYK